MSEQELIDAAKAPTVAYNEKDWDAVRAAITSGSVYDEVATQRKMEGADQVIEGWQGWATENSVYATVDTEAQSGYAIHRRQ